mmetsp:Transcript_1433/g.2126  ORF Transcript_1433/g.2126 Transcript_1433/m.2126 type:complete len:225 (-) Transcript_1433:1286-1960(-)
MQSSGFSSRRSFKSTLRSTVLAVTLPDPTCKLGTFTEGDAEESSSNKCCSDDAPISSRREEGTVLLSNISRLSGRSIGPFNPSFFFSHDSTSGDEEEFESSDLGVPPTREKNIDLKFGSVSINLSTRAGTTEGDCGDLHSLIDDSSSSVFFLHPSLFLWGPPFFSHDARGSDEDKFESSDLGVPPTWEQNNDFKFGSVSKLDTQCSLLHNCGVKLLLLLLASFS